MNILLQESDYILVIGPTAGMIPDAFFKRGVTVMGSILVTKPDELLKKFRFISRKRFYCLKSVVSYIFKVLKA
ncbi:Rossmann-like domain-containing protein [Lachnoanaerobaculum saburreum]|uniref:Putative heavy-metal chelation domain-containing protein n=1 Tax=Lachnoanaerobaculum saburreum DSM 3986 TaxID=887325 RepID=E6LRW0_9FIRM|nr:DUF364 domain-containing protein [Lachnoanaerobaculum saburreum]EFU75337.1 hypothetical protein HMPREF0381_2695 [Lachnoanaerobaculum saburreum DSM 3986]